MPNTYIVSRFIDIRTPSFLVWAFLRESYATQLYPHRKAYIVYTHLRRKLNVHISGELRQAPIRVDVHRISGEVWERACGLLRRSSSQQSQPEKRQHHRQPPHSYGGSSNSIPVLDSCTSCIYELHPFL